MKKQQHKQQQQQPKKQQSSYNNNNSDTSFLIKPLHVVVSDQDNHLQMLCHAFLYNDHKEGPHSNECSPSIGGVGGDYLRGGREEDTYLVIPTLHHTVG